MRRFTLRLIVALLTFVIGIAAASLWFTLRHSSPMTIKRAENLSPAATLAQPERKYKEGIAAKTVSKDGTPASSSLWYIPDGMTFSRWSEYHASPEHANRELQKTLKKAVKIIKREPLFDENGLEVGEKVIAIFPPKYSEYGAATLLWTDGSTFHYVSSSSLENILEYEKDCVESPTQSNSSVMPSLVWQTK